MSSPACAAQPSYIVLPRQADAPATVFEFLVGHFTQVTAEQWQQRIIDGKVHWQDGQLIELTTPYRPATRVYYYREVSHEKKIPFAEQILYQDEYKIIVVKPHFLPVTPSGHFVNECLVHRLRIATGIETIAPAHRLDRDTAGVMLMTVQPETRHRYHELFAKGRIHKRYHALAKLTPPLLQQYQQGELVLPYSVTVKNRLQKSTPSFLMQIVEGENNSHSEISLVAVKGDIGLFELSPITGKTHQLRMHMLSLGMPLINDRFYPELQPKTEDDFERPLQLMARSLEFTDPMTNQPHFFEVDGLTKSLQSA